MKEQTEQNINQAIDWLQKTGAEQAPLYCQELLKWHLVTGIVGAAVGLCIFVVAIISLYRTRCAVKKGIVNFDSFLFTAWSTMAIGFGGLMAAASGFRAIKAEVSPRLVIVEHFTRMK